MPEPDTTQALYKDDPPTVPSSSAQWCLLISTILEINTRTTSLIDTNYSRALYNRGGKVQNTPTPRFTRDIPVVLWYVKKDPYNISENTKYNPWPFLIDEHDDAGPGVVAVWEEIYRRCQGHVECSGTLPQSATILGPAPEEDHWTCGHIRQEYLSFVALSAQCKSELGKLCVRQLMHRTHPQWHWVISQGKIPWKTPPRPGTEPGPQRKQTVRYIHSPTELSWLVYCGTFLVKGLYPMYSIDMTATVVYFILHK